MAPSSDHTRVRTDSPIDLDTEEKNDDERADSRNLRSKDVEVAPGASEAHAFLHPSATQAVKVTQEKAAMPASVDAQSLTHPARDAKTKAQNALLEPSSVGPRPCRLDRFYDNDFITSHITLRPVSPNLHHHSDTHPD